MPVLSILVPTLVCRRHYLARLLAVLNPQIDAAGGADVVQLLPLEDDGQLSIGGKRNVLAAQAQGEYQCAIDDDDLPAADYVARVLDAIKSNPGVDCVGFRQRRFSDGKRIGEAIYSLRCGKYGSRQLADGGTFYYRTPNHLSPIRSDLVRQLAEKQGGRAFPEKNWEEDKDYALAIFPLLRTEAFVDAYLYDYLYRTPYTRRAEKVNIA